METFTLEALKKAFWELPQVELYRHSMEAMESIFFDEPLKKLSQSEHEELRRRSQNEGWRPMGPWTSLHAGVHVWHAMAKVLGRTPEELTLWARQNDPEILSLFQSDNRIVWRSGEWAVALLHLAARDLRRHAPPDVTTE